jgi:hypothetical protein
MPSPFPGMNPYLEAPALWSEVHSWLIVELARMLNQSITPKYRAAVEKRVYEESILVGIPDVSIVRQSRLIQPPIQPPAPRQSTTMTLSQPVLVELPESASTTERYLEIREVATGDVVTVVEILSPKNKRPGEGREQYISKRMQLLSSQSHLVEIDLLRGGEPLPMDYAGTSDYRVLVSPVEQRPMAQLFPFDVQEALPSFALPLRAGDGSPVIDLKALMQVVYESAALDLAIDYHQQPIPPLPPDQFKWVQAICG